MKLSFLRTIVIMLFRVQNQFISRVPQFQCSLFAMGNTHVEHVMPIDSRHVLAHQESPSSRM